jgi:hypothetical protein
VLSVVIPTLNCAEELPAHLESMALWLDLATEVVVVDSFSDDGSLDVIRATLKHDDLRILEHPRGLYQSWNHAISHTTQEWIYISTIGDTITRGQLQHLLETGTRLGSDVVVSPPSFVVADHLEITPPVWPIRGLLEFHEIDRPTEIDPAAAFYHSLSNIPNSILGSSASNLYRGGHLRARPFPTTFRGAGDTAWALQHALETRFCFTPEVGSVFRFHSETYSVQDPDVWLALCESMRDLAMAALAASPLSQTGSGLVAALLAFKEAERELHAAQAGWGSARKAGSVSWWLRPPAVRARSRRNKARQAYHEAVSRMEESLRALPLKALG